MSTQDLRLPRCLFELLAEPPHDDLGLSSVRFGNLPRAQRGQILSRLRLRLRQHEQLRRNAFDIALEIPWPQSQRVLHENGARFDRRAPLGSRGAVAAPGAVWLLRDRNRCRQCREDQERE